MPRPPLVDWIVAAGLAALLATVTFYRSSQIPDQLFVDDALGDVWFDADLAQRACLMQWADAPHHSVSSEHPLVSSLMHPPALLLQQLGATPIDSFRGVAALHAGAWMAALFGLLRRITRGWLAALVFSALAAVSAAATFGLVVPEVFTLGAMSLLAPLALAARPAGPSSLWRYTLASAGTMSATITNWVTGAVAPFLITSPTRAIAVNTAAVVLVIGAVAVQSHVYPQGRPIASSGRFGEELPTLPHAVLREAITAFLLHAMVMPAFSDGRDDWSELLSVQQSPPAFSLPSVIAVAGWTALLVSGGIALARGALPAPFRLLLITSLAAQLLLHCIFGVETFLYAMHYVTLLLVLAACGARGPWRRTVMAVAAITTIVAAANNHTRFADAIAYTESLVRAPHHAGFVWDPSGDCGR